MMRRRYFWWGVCGTVASLLCIAIVLVVQLGFAYDGKCGGFLPWLAGPKACSFWEYLSGTSLSVALILLDTYWPFILALLVLPAFVGYLFDRRGRGHAA
jgi:hypothetical protein